MERATTAVRDGVNHLDDGVVRTNGVRVGYDSPDVRTGANMMPVRNRVQWGPILAGVLTALATLLVLAVLGLAIGSSAYEPGVDASDWGTGAGIWGGLSLIVALFLGGWVAAKTAAVDGQFAGLMNGLMAGIGALLLLLWLTTTGVTNLFGFLGNNIADIASVAAETTTLTGTDANAAQDQGQQAVQDAQAVVQGAAGDETTYDRVAAGAWGTLLALILAIGAAALGGLLGFNKRHDLITGTGAGT